MSIDVLQNKIRKLKSPFALSLAPQPELIPPAVLSSCENVGEAYGVYCAELLSELRDILGAVRVNFDAFALAGAEGLASLQMILNRAKELGYYVILDWMHLEDATYAKYASKVILEDELWKCDGVSLSVWAGSDCVKPYIAAADGGKKDVYVSLKTGNKSGTELQDLQTGGRVVYTAAGDLVSRWGENALERCGYSRIAGIAGAVNASSLRSLRQKYPRVFLLVEGLETSGANAKNCSYAFDRMGYGALLCVGSSVLGAWKESDGTSYLAAAREELERHRRNIGRYITIL